MTTHGSVWGWGENLGGNLAVGTTGAFILLSPTQMPNPGSGIIQLAAGNDHVLGLPSDGIVVAWGGNAYGQLGDGATIASVIPVQVSGLSGVSGGFETAASAHPNVRKLADRRLIAR
jgi:alpha-tubulin suppressor-like RCC1 family protein